MFKVIKRLFERGESDIRFRSIWIPEKCKVGVAVKVHCKVVNYGTKTGRYECNVEVSPGSRRLARIRQYTISPKEERIEHFVVVFPAVLTYRVTFYLDGVKKYRRGGNIVVEAAPLAETTSI